MEPFPQIVLFIYFYFIFFQMFYRVHSSILKQLMYDKELDYNLLEEYLERVNREEIYLEIFDSDEAWLKGLKIFKMSLQIDNSNENISIFEDHFVKFKKFNLVIFFLV